MTAAPSLYAIAPRLARARAQRVLELRNQRAARRLMRHELLALERLVAHRELQLMRSAQRIKIRDRRAYVAERDDKLGHARQQLADAQTRATQIGVA